MPSGADLEYQRLLRNAGLSNDEAAGYDGGRLEQLNNTRSFTEKVLASLAPITVEPIQDTASVEFVGSDPTARWLSADGKRLFGFTEGGSVLSESTNGGLSWKTLKTFNAQLGGVRELANGELLVCVRQDPGEMWVSSGYSFGHGGSSASWSKTLTMSVLSAHAHNSYSWSPPLHHLDDLPSDVNKGIILVGEYGNQADAPDKAYLSEDYGKTWRIIFDPVSSVGHHHHGVAYDPWGDAVWVSTGDGSVEKQLSYSTDWRNTTPTWTEVSLGTAQPVGIWPTPDAILLGSDAAPNGIHRIERLQGAAGYGPLTTPYLTDDNDFSLTYFTQCIYKRPGGPLIFPFVPNTVGGAAPEDKGFIVVTYDGRTFTEIWRETQEYVDTTYQGQYGVVGAFGPTVQDTLVGYVRDDFRGSGAFPRNSKITAPWPEEVKTRLGTASKVYTDLKVNEIRPNGWETPTLNANIAQRVGYYPVAARKEQGDIVRLRGQFTFVGAYTAGTEVLVLPTHLRPKYSVIVVTRTISGFSSVFISSTTGGLAVQTAGTDGQWVALDGITYNM